MPFQGSGCGCGDENRGIFDLTDVAFGNVMCLKFSYSSY